MGYPECLGMAHACEGSESGKISSKSSQVWESWRLSRVRILTGSRKLRIRWDRWGTLARVAKMKDFLDKLVSMGKPAVEKNKESHRKEKAENRNRDASISAFASTATSSS